MVLLIKSIRRLKLEHTPVKLKDKGTSQDNRKLTNRKKGGKLGKPVKKHLERTGMYQDEDGR
jgi:hypothetical protein